MGNKIKYIFSLILIFLCACNLSGQTQPSEAEGKISYITSQSIYVKFESTEFIEVGDTLYFQEEGKLVPAMVVKNLSSISCVCSPISSKEFNVSDRLIFKIKTAPNPVVEIPATYQDTVLQPVLESDTIPEQDEDKKELEQDIRGRLSVSSYSNFSNSPAANTQRMRYTFSLNADHLGNSKLSAETYMSFVHSNKNWNEIESNIFNGLKVYKFSLKYDFNETTSLTLGRKINPKLSSVGAIDGFQFEKKIRDFSVGAFVGSRPDYMDYSINLNLFQYGIYAGHEHTVKNGMMQSTMGYIQQDNDWQTDRRFLYFQHINTIVKNLYFFGSAEMDLYKKVDNNPESTFNLTNLYLSLRYRVIKQLSLGLSYSARQNIIYYETYKDFVERLLETETLQGWRFQVNYRPVKFLSLGVNVGYRYRPEDPKASQNLYAYATYSNIPGLDAAATISVTLLETSYISGKIYGIGLTRDILKGKVSAGLKYKYVDYLYSNTEFTLVQNFGELNLSWRIYKKLSLSIYYEGTFEKEQTFNRIYANLSFRF
ncbi:MAG: hypothetical protein R2750_02570 [Bacteroidales bacterium]